MMLRESRPCYIVGDVPIRLFLPSPGRRHGVPHRGGLRLGVHGLPRLRRLARLVYVSDKKFAWYELGGGKRMVEVPTRIGPVRLEIGEGSARVLIVPMPQPAVRQNR